MMKKISIFVMVLFTLIFNSTLVQAVNFALDSAKITNPYFPSRVGDWRVTLGVSGGQLNGRFGYFHVVGTEAVSGAKIGEQTFNNVNCLKANYISTKSGGTVIYEFITFWMAQDTDGNVWFLKVYVNTNGMEALLGGDLYQSMFMPAAPAVGLPGGITIPEDQNNYCRIVEINTAVVTTFGSYNNCIKTNCLLEQNPSKTEVEYYCRDVGSVRNFRLGTSGDVMDLKEVHRIDYYGDANRDGKVSLEDAIYTLQVLSGSR